MVLFDVLDDGAVLVVFGEWTAATFVLQVKLLVVGTLLQHHFTDVGTELYEGLLLPDGPVFQNLVLFFGRGQFPLERVEFKKDVFDFFL